MKTYDVLREIENALRSPFVTRKSVRLLNDFFQNRALLDATASDGVLSERLTPQAAYLWRDLRREVCQEYPEGPLEQVFPPGALEQVKTYWLEPCPNTSGSGHYVRGRLTPGSVVIDEDECYTVKGPYNCQQGKEVGSLQVVGDCDSGDCNLTCPLVNSLDVVLSGADVALCNGCQTRTDIPNDYTMTSLAVDGNYNIPYLDTVTVLGNDYCRYRDAFTPGGNTYGITRYPSSDGSCTGSPSSSTGTGIVVTVLLNLATSSTPVSSVVVSTTGTNAGTSFSWLGNDYFAMSPDPPAAYGDSVSNLNTPCQDTANYRQSSGGTAVVTDGG